MTTTITYANGNQNDCDSTTSWTSVCPIGLAAAGYVDCVAGDVGKAVTDDGAGIGNLISYDNALRVWVVATSNQVVVASAMAITAGVGQGTSDAGIVVAARTFSTDGDSFTFGGTTADVTRVEYWGKDLDFTDISQTSYPYLTIKFKTSVASGGLQAYAQVYFADGSQSNHALGYSTDWKVSTVQPTSVTSTTISGIRLYAYEDAAANANGTYYAYFDWFQFHKNTFTFPHDSDIDVNILKNIGNIQIPGRKGNILQNLGIDTPVIRMTIEPLEGERDNTTNKWRSASTEPDFNYLLMCFYEDLWSYFTCNRPLIRCQVMFVGINYGVRGPERKQYLNLYFLLYKEGPYSLFPDYSWIWNKA